jgi:hypothetical protein
MVNKEVVLGAKINLINNPLYKPFIDNIALNSYNYMTPEGIDVTSIPKDIRGLKTFNHLGTVITPMPTGGYM